MCVRFVTMYSKVAVYVQVYRVKVRLYACCDERVTSPDRVFGFLAAIVLLYLPPLSSLMTFCFAVMKDFCSFDSVK